jgi:hypothetical protein
MPWMLPGIAPTNRHVEVPLVAIVHFRGDKLAHEHIYRDQASVLKQIGSPRDDRPNTSRDGLRFQVYIGAVSWPITLSKRLQA